VNRYSFLILKISVCLALCNGCGGPPPEPSVVEIPGYDSLQEQFTGRDLSPLRDRRIVLDPGHGGFFSGAVGPTGLTEAEVNLGVSLYLRGLLEWAGAEVHMTRTADYDFLTATDSTLTSDLAFRSSFTDSLQPDVFLSLHHNSVATLDRTVNETQTYYPLGDDGASLDLARAIHRHLVLNLEISPAKILPGNFHVLRNATVPAVLGEPAMISHPVIEGRLSLAASQRLEAEAYFLGLLDYFSQGSPYWAGAPIDTLVIAEDQISVRASWVYLLDFFHQEDQMTRSQGPDPGTFRLTLDRREVPFHVTGQGRFVHWLLADPDLVLPAILELTGRNLAGRATPVRRTVLMPGPARRVKLTLMPESLEEKGGYIGVRWSVPGHAPLPDGNLMFSMDAGSGVGQTLPVMGGISGAALLPRQGGTPTRVEFSAGTNEDPPLPCDITIAALPQPWRWRQLTCSDGTGAGPWSYRSGLPDGLPSGMADQMVPLIPYQPGQPVWVTAPGVLPLIDPDPANPDTCRTVVAGEPIWLTEAIVPGLRGKIIVLDPAGGGNDTDGTGPLGLRGATLNLETALLTKGLLEGCGAVVHLTRRGETTIPAEEKVRLAGEVDADFFLTIGRSRQPNLLTASHHPGSETGLRWAGLFLRGAAGLGTPGDSLAVTASYDYLLRHTACPALEVRLPGPQSPGQEMYLSQRGWQRAEARAVLLSLASMFETEGRLISTLDVASILRDLPGAPEPSSVVWAELDGNLIWSPVPVRENGADLTDLSSDRAEPLDSSRYPGLPALLERHTLEIRALGVQQLWLLEKSGSGYSARLMMHNP
jgi:N-acetylmuramoyl-L-alanine amidase